MTSDEVTGSEVRNLIELVSPGGSKGLQQDTAPLSGVLDSLAMMQLFVLIEKTMGIRISPAEVQPKDFETVGTLATLLTRLKAASERPARREEA